MAASLDNSANFALACQRLWLTLGSIVSLENSEVVARTCSPPTWRLKVFEITGTCCATGMGMEAAACTTSTHVGARTDRLTDIFHVRSSDSFFFQHTFLALSNFALPFGFGISLPVHSFGTYYHLSLIYYRRHGLHSRYAFCDILHHCHLHL
jgi:hypothetical protein